MLAEVLTTPHCHMHDMSQLPFRSLVLEIYFLSFERSELEGKYSLIVSMYACMHCVWEIIVCCHSGDAGLCVYVACMDGLAQLVGI